MKIYASQDYVQEKINEIKIPDTIAIDATLTQEGRAADAKAVGDTLATKITAPSAAAVGQTIIVKAIDENGKPIEWETKDVSINDNIQSDWNELDNTSAAYIQNKPFGYTENIIKKRSEVHPNSTQNNVYIDNGTVVDWALVVNGNTYIVIWDDQSYTLEAKEMNLWVENGNGHMICNNALGNPSVAAKYLNDPEPAEDTGEPFAIIPQIGIYFLEEGTHSIVIKDPTPVLNKIDVKYLPDEALKTPVQADWNETNENNLSFIKNKPEIPNTENFATKEYVNEKIATIEIPDSGDSFEQVQADWAETDESSPAYIKNKPNISVDGDTSVQANWEQNDSSQLDYIKNRPFYEYEDRIEILPLLRRGRFYLDQTYGYTFGMSTTYDLVIGESYIVHWDGQEYECVAQDANSVIPNAVALGNAAPFGLLGNNEPFVIASLSGGGSQYCALTDTEEGALHDIGIYKKVILIQKIDQKYLPENIGGSSLPEVTTSDVGKFLRVSADGLWVAEAIPSAEEASF